MHCPIIETTQGVIYMYVYSQPLVTVDLGRIQQLPQPVLLIVSLCIAQETMAQITRGAVRSTRGASPSRSVSPNSGEQEPPII